MQPQDILKRYFGYAEFRKGQKEIIDAILNQRDALAVMPTGAGKSVCYQVPALLLPGITLVISPLISLMQDQVKALNTAGIHAAYINSSLSEAQISKALQLAVQGIYKIIYVAPERLESRGFQWFASHTDISMVTVDEAHCISQWGQDFRPSYLKIVEFVSSLKSRPIISAFTATATEDVKRDILCILGLNNPKVLVTGFDRPNLYFEVNRVKKKDDFVTDYIGKHPSDSGIIYCATRKNVDNLFALLYRKGISVSRYHAGMSTEDRKKSQNDFIYDQSLVMIATNAFGMGIDKSNVRYVIHYNMPQSMENYYQEAGRAGRDGYESDCILLYSPQDVMINKMLLEHKDFSTSGVENAEVLQQRDLQRLRMIENYCQTTDCLRIYILRYFGEQTGHDCGNCSNCRKAFDELDVTKEAKSIINCVSEAHGRFGINIISGTLVGANRARLKEVGAINYVSYGILKESGEDRIKKIIGRLVEGGYLILTEDQYSVLKLGSHAMDLKNDSVRIYIKVQEETYPEKKTQNIPKTKDQLTSAGYRLFADLRDLRTAIARETNMPPYIIFSDKTLIDMCLKLPVTKEEMLSVSGVAATKYDRYGERFIEAIKNSGIVKNNYEQPTNENDSFSDSNGNKKRGKRKKEEGWLTCEEASSVKYNEYCFISDLGKAMNEAYTDNSRKKITRKQITDCLEKYGLIKVVADATCKRFPTERGILEGIKKMQRLNFNGETYTLLQYPENIQRMVVEYFTMKNKPEKQEKPISNPTGHQDNPRPKVGAYAPWSVGEDNRLKLEYKEGKTISAIAKDHQRTKGAIRARLKKNGLITEI